MGRIKAIVLLLLVCNTLFGTVYDFTVHKCNQNVPILDSVLVCTNLRIDHSDNTVCLSYKDYNDCMKDVIFIIDDISHDKRYTIYDLYLGKEKYILNIETCDYNSLRIAYLESKRTKRDMVLYLKINFYTLKNA